MMSSSLLLSSQVGGLLVLTAVPRSCYPVAADLPALSLLLYLVQARRTRQ